MSYTPNTWETGDTITAEKLNNMEQGIANAGGGPLIVMISFIPDDEYYNMIMDKTWQQIYDAALSTGVIFLQQIDDINGYENRVLGSISNDNSQYAISVVDEFTTDSANGYPQTSYS